MIYLGILRRIARQVIAALAVVTLALPAVAAPKKSSAAFTITPTSLRTQVLRENLSVLNGLNAVYQAKEQVNIARAGVLPSLNLGMTLSGLATSPTFALSSVSVLVPFLLPSNWYNIDVAEKTMVANGYAFHGLELNTFASAYALYITTLGDLRIKEILKEQLVRAEQIRDVVEERVQIGVADLKDLYRADGVVGISRAQYLQVEELVVQEVALIRQMLGLPLTREIKFEQVHPPSHPLEGKSAQSVLHQVVAKSPEARQVNALIKAAEAATWSATYNFLSGVSLSVGAFGGASVPSFSSLQATGGVGIGFDYGPRIRLTHLQRDLLHQRLVEIRLEQARILESTLGSIEKASRQLAAAQLAEASYKDVWDRELQDYASGRSDILRVLDAASFVTNATTMRVRAQADLDQQRVNLHRVMISDQFSQIPECRLEALDSKDKAGPFSVLRRVLSERSASISVDQLCRAKSDIKKSVPSQVKKSKRRIG